ncbi:MAG: addiction module protein [Deltaproteobacteria bacterium]
MASFDKHARTSVDEAWALEAERRIDSYDAGETVAVSLSESRERINCR